MTARGKGSVGCARRLVSRAAMTFADFWIPAFAGMTGGWEAGMRQGEIRDDCKRGRDPLAAVRAWFRAAVPFAGVWIPAFAGMTGERRE